MKMLNVFATLLLICFIALFFVACQSDEDGDSDDEVDNNDSDENDDDDDEGEGEDWDEPCFDEGELLEPDPPGALVYAIQYGNFIFFYSQGALNTIPSTLNTQLGNFSATQVAGFGSEHGNQSAVMLPDGADMSALENVVFAGIYPRLKMDEKGYFHLLYYNHFRKQLMYSENTTGVFQTEVVQSDFENPYWEIYFEISPAGDPHFLYYDWTMDSKKLIYYQRINKSWKNEILLQTNREVIGYHIAVDSQNTAHVLYVKDNGATLVLSNNASGKHEQYDMILPTLPSLKDPIFRSPQIALSKDDGRIISFGYGDGKTFGAFYTAVKENYRWVPSKIRGGMYIGSFSHQMLLNSADIPVFLWTDQHRHYFVQKVNEKWGSSQALDCMDWTKPDHQLLLDDTDAPHITFPCQIGHYTDDGMEVRQRYFEDGIWKTALAAPGGMQFSGLMQIEYSHTNGFYSLLLSGSSTLMIGNMSNGVWDFEVLHTFKPDSDRIHFDLNIDENGDPIVVFSDRKTMTYVSKSSGSWIEEKSWDITDLEVNDFTLILDPIGNPQIIYIQDSDETIRQFFYDGAIWNNELLYLAPHPYGILARYDTNDRLHIFIGSMHMYEQGGIWQTEPLTSGEYYSFDITSLPDGDMLVVGAGNNELCTVSGNTGAWAKHCESINFQLRDGGIALSSENEPLLGVSFMEGQTMIYNVAESDWQATQISTIDSRSVDMAISDTGEVCLMSAARGTIVVYCANEIDIF